VFLASGYVKICYESTEKQKIKDTEERNELHEFLLGLFNVDKLPANIVVQIEKMRKEHDFRYKGILLTLDYFHNIQHNPVDKMSVGIVPHIYDECKAYYIQKAKRKKQIENVNMENEVETVVIKRKKNSDNEYLNSKLIDIDKI
jgi:hypothetical protein